MATDVTFATNIDLANNELRNAKAHILASAPTGVEGKFYYDSTTKKLYYYNGTTWVSAAGVTLGDIVDSGLFLQVAGGTMTGLLTLDDSGIVVANSSAKPRWKIVATGNEGGSNSGSDLALWPYLDGEAQTQYPALTITRADAGRQFRLSGDLYVAGTGIQVQPSGLQKALLQFQGDFDRFGMKMQSGLIGEPAFTLTVTDANIPSTDLSKITYISDFENSKWIFDKQISLSSKKIIDLANGTAAGDAVNKSQLDGKANTVHTHPISDVTGLQPALDAKAPLNSPAFTGTPTAPTAAPATNNTQVATTGFVAAAVSAAAAGLDVKQSVKAATTGNVDLAEGINLATVDGISIATGERVLVKEQADQSENGIYTRGPGTTANIRATDADTSAKVTAGMFMFVEQGTQLADTGWVLTTDNPIDLGTTALRFSQFSGPGQYTFGNGLVTAGKFVHVGAGSGIVVDPDAVSIDTNVVVRKTSTLLATSATSYVVAHYLGTRNVQVSIVQQNAPYGVVYTSWEATTANEITVYFATAPAANSLRVNVVG